jgi:hypothetical protein
MNEQLNMVKQIPVKMTDQKQARAGYQWLTPVIPASGG